MFDKIPLDTQDTLIGLKFPCSTCFYRVLAVVVCGGSVTVIFFIESRGLSAPDSVHLIL